MKTIFISILILLILLISCELNEREVEYWANCTSGTVDITISGKDESTEQFSDVATPWSYEFTASKDDFVYISAQNNQDWGTVTVKIYVDGDKWKEASSTGAYVIASVSGILD